MASAGYTWPTTLAALIAGRDLPTEQTDWAMDEVMAGEVSPTRLAAFLIGLRAKGETVEELTGLAAAMLRHSRRFDARVRCVDIVGTGGDGAHTVNVSTMASLVIAGTGIPVVKHGNRAATSSSGSADVLEALGIRLDRTPQRVASLVAEVGITFCFAQVFHPSMRHAAVARKDLGVPTAFNFLGPLTNPAQPAATAVGVADPVMAPLIAGVFASRGTSALVFRGDDGLDELAATGASTVWVVSDGSVDVHRLDPTVDLGLDAITVEDLRGADAVHNAGVARRFLAGEPGPVRQTVLLNAAAGIVADGRLPGTGTGTLVERLRAGLDHAARAVDDGAAADVLTRWAAVD